MSVVQQIENGLLARLAQAFTHDGDARPWLKVEAWPVRPEGYRLTPPGDVFVIWRGTKYRVEDTSSKFYDARLEYEITIRARSLRDNSGAYGMVETARNAVCGWRLEGAADVTTPASEGFVDYGEAVFAYSLLVIVPVLLVPTGTDRVPGPYIDSNADYGRLTRIGYQLDEIRQPQQKGEI